MLRFMDLKLCVGAVIKVFCTAIKQCSRKLSRDGDSNDVFFLGSDY
jgi:hypothetical protein